MRTFFKPTPASYTADDLAKAFEALNDNVSPQGPQPYSPSEEDETDLDYERANRVWRIVDLARKRSIIKRPSSSDLVFLGRPNIERLYDKITLATVENYEDQSPRNNVFEVAALHNLLRHEIGPKEHAYPLSSGPIVGYVNPTKELEHDGRNAGRSVA